MLADHKRLRGAPDLVLSDRVQNRYPQVVCDLLETMFTVTNPVPKQGALKVARSALKRSGIRWRDAINDGWKVWRVFG